MSMMKAAAAVIIDFFMFSQKIYIINKLKYAVFTKERVEMHGKRE